MSPINFDMDSSSTRPSQSRVVPKDELFGLEVKQMRLFENDSYRLLFDFSPVLNQILYHFKMDLFMLDKEGLNLTQILKVVNTEDLVEEFNGSWSIVLQSILVNLFERY
jgi:hypothetical protein